MAASQKYNRYKAELDKLERQAIAKTSVASLKAAREKLAARADTFYARRAEAFAWRRKLVNAGFTRKRVTEKIPSLGRLCDALIDAICERGECDFVRDLAAPLPMAVIGDMLGVLPEERGMLLKWSEDLVSGLSSHLDPMGPEFQTVMNAFAGYTEFTMGIIAKRRAEPTDDLFSILVNAEVEGQRMSDDEIVMETLLILIGGDETTRHTLSGGTEQLVRHRDQWDALRTDSDALLPGAIEEMLQAGEILALAHHRDDQAETVLLKLLRGAGPEGLGAMRMLRRLGRGFAWRPLLTLPRASLRAYAEHHRLVWIEDPSNADFSLDRNFLRIEVLPRITRRWPEAEASIAQSATWARAAGSFAIWACSSLMATYSPPGARPRKTAPCPPAPSRPTTSN